MDSRLQAFENLNSVPNEGARQFWLNEITVKMTEIVGAFNIQKGNTDAAGDDLKMLAELREKIRQLPAETNGYVVELSNAAHGTSVKITPTYIAEEFTEQGEVLGFINLETQVMIGKVLCQRGCCAAAIDQEHYMADGNDFAYIINKK